MVYSVHSNTEAEAGQWCTVYTRTLRLRLVNGVHLNTEAEAGQWCTLEHWG